MHRLQLFFGAFAVVGAISCATADPQERSDIADEDGFGIREITVTARRVQEDNQRVPIAITVIPGAELQDRGVFTTETFGQMAPGLTVTQAYGSRDDAFFNIRGQLFGVVNYFDEVPITNPQPGSIRPQSALYSPLTLDAENAQVLRGPQGTLFGRNATGGAVLFTPNRPGDTLSADLAASCGNFDYQEYQGTLNVPLADDKFLIRLVADRTTRHGFTRNLFDGTELDDVDTNTVRASVVIRPFEGLETRLLFQHVYSSEAGSGSQLEYAAPLSPFTTIGPLFTGIPTATMIANELANGPRDVTIFHPRGMPLSNKDDETFISNVTSYHASSAITLKNIFGYYEYSDSHLTNFAQSLIPFMYNLTPPGVYAEHNQQFTDEAQLQFKSFEDRFDGVLGAFYGLNEPKGTSAAYTAYFTTTPSGTINSDNVAPAARQTSVAGFAQSNLDLSDWILKGLTFTSGLRITRDEVKSGAAQSVVGAPNYSFTTTACGTGGLGPSCILFVPLEAGYTAKTYTFALDYQISQELLAYLTTRKGYRPGGFNSPIAQLTPFRSYQPEYLTDYEAGIKSNFDVLGMPTRINLAAYYGKYKDIQVNDTVDLSVYTGSATAQYGNVEQNAAKGTVKGFEAELTVQPVHRLSVTAYAALTHAEYNSFTEIIQQPGVPLVPVDVSKSPFPNTPKWTFSLSSEYELPLPRTYGRLAVNGTYYYQSATVGAAGGTFFEPWAAIGAWSSTNFGLTWHEIVNSRFDATFFLNNAFDQTHVTGLEAASVLAIRTTLYSEPRMYGAKIAYHFGGSH
jgi:iron complex outermembrane recepter protein